ncbi:MAG: T9SS type A sorting domain-containing protein [Bacteroidales bacterium]|nr:T9SS type A sorting domain-containing protein [Bacteroidales bacterium]
MKTLKQLLVFSALIIVAVKGFAATITSKATGNWSATSTWVGDVVPAIADDVVINGGYTVTVDGSYSCNSLTLNNGAGVALIINSLCSLTVSGNVGYTNGIATITNNGTLSIGGTFTNVNNGGTFTNNGTISVSGTITIGNNVTTFNNNGTFTIADLSLGNANLNWTNGTNSTLNISGTITNPSRFVLTATASGNTVNYNGAAQAVKAVNYYNLTLSGSGDKTFSVAETISGTLSINGTAKAALAVATNSTANELILGGVGEAAGTWGSTNSIATNKNDTYFALSTGYVTVSTTTGCTKVDGLNKLSVITLNKQIKIIIYGNTGKQSIVTVYDILGNEVIKETLSNNQTVIDIEVAGTYIVKVKTGDNVYIDKVVVK